MKSAAWRGKVSIMAERTKKKASLFHYEDYRKFLRDWYKKAKASRASFSFRTFSQRAGFRSTNFFKLVMDGDRNLTEESLPNFMKGLRLNKQEQEFFRNLVFFNQAKTHEQRDFYYQRLLRSRKYNQLKPIEKSQYDFYSTWYHPVIRELAISKDFDGAPKWIAEQISPSITVAQVEKSIELLERLGFIEKAGPKKWRQSSPLISTGPEVTSLILMNYHHNLLDLTKEILTNVPADKRDVSAMTLGIVKDRLPTLKKKIQEFRKEVLKFVALDTHPDTVVQLNVQMYPMTQSKEEES